MHDEDFETFAKEQIAMLLGAGFTEDEARALLGACLGAEDEPDLDAVREWIRWCARTRQHYEYIIQPAARGELRVAWTGGENPVEVLAIKQRRRA